MKTCPCCGKETKTCISFKHKKALTACIDCDMAEHPTTGVWTFFVGGLKTKNKK